MPRNVTIRIPDDLFNEAQKIAITRKESVSSLLRSILVERLGTANLPRYRKKAIAVPTEGMFQAEHLRLLAYRYKHSNNKASVTEFYAALAEKARTKAEGMQITEKQRKRVARACADVLCAQRYCVEAFPLVAVSQQDMLKKVINHIIGVYK